MKRALSNNYNLKKIYPEVVNLFHKLKNKHLNPENLLPTSGEIACFVCPHCKKEKYQPISRIAYAYRKFKYKKNKNKRFLSCSSCSKGKILSEKYNFQSLYPSILKELHPTKNDHLDLKSISPYSEKKLFFICYKCKEEFSRSAHERISAYKTALKKKKDTHFCPYCTGKKTSSKNNLSFIKPDLIKEWHPTLNDRQPNEFRISSSYKAWWICFKKKKHPPYQARIQSRTRVKSGCPYCYNKPFSGNNLATIFPILIKNEWDFKKNIKPPTDYLPKSSKKVWWICSSCKSSYSKLIYVRTTGTGCQICRSGNNRISKNQLRIFCELKKVFKNIKLEHSLKKAQIDIFLEDLKLAIEYDGSRFHKYNKNILKDIKKNNLLKSIGLKVIRVRETPLKLLDEEYDVKAPGTLLKKIHINPILIKINNKFNLSNETRVKIYSYVENKDFINDYDYNYYISKYPNPIKELTLEYKYPKIAKEWDYKRNYPFTPNNITFGIQKEFYFICGNCKSSYKIGLAARIKRQGSQCINCNLLYKLDKEFEIYFDKSKNFKKLKSITLSHHYNIWFICKSCEKSYKTTGRRFVSLKEKMCNDCLRKNKIYNKPKSIFIAIPDLKSELNFNRNKNIDFSKINKTDEISIDWICENGHSYKMNARTKYENFKNNKISCPKCLLKIRIQKSRLATNLKITHPILCNQWNYDKNGKLKPEMYTKASRDKVWWLCSICNHEWGARIVNRAKKLGCPKYRSH